MSWYMGSAHHLFAARSLILWPPSPACAQVAFFLSWAALPAEFTGIFTADPLRVVKNWHMFFCVASGLWGGLAIGIATEYYTSNRYEPVRVRLTCNFLVPKSTS